MLSRIDISWRQTQPIPENMEVDSVGTCRRNESGKGRVDLNIDILRTQPSPENNQEEVGDNGVLRPPRNSSSPCSRKRNH